MVVIFLLAEMFQHFLRLNLGEADGHCCAGVRVMFLQLYLASFWQVYPLVNVYITMENHHVQWANPRTKRQFSIAILT